MTLKIAPLNNWVIGTDQVCNWDWGNLDGNVEVTLWKANHLVVTLSASCSVGENGKGSAIIGVPAKLSPGGYEVWVKSISHPEVEARQPVNIVANTKNRSLPFDDGSRSPGPRG